MSMILAFLEQFSAARPQNEWYQQSNKYMTGVYIILPQITATTTVLFCLQGFFTNNNDYDAEEAAAKSISTPH